MLKGLTLPRAFRRAIAVAVLALSLPAAACAPNGPAEAAPDRVAGTARVIDGMTFEIAGTTVRLFGIDTPDLAQNCERKGRTIPCGNVSRTALMDLVAGTTATCTTVKDRRAANSQENSRPGSPMVATCSAGGFDIGNNMVHTGWALADPKTAPRRYRTTEANARKRKVGLWRMKFDFPWDWRANKRARSDGSEICVRGQFTDEGAECPTLRDAEGVLYTIARRDIGFEPGREICVCGRVAEISFCMQGETLVASRIGPASDCP